MSLPTATPQVWIGSLHAYNNGSLIGEWVDADDLDQLQEAERRVLEAGGGEEIALMDFEGFGKMIGEYTPLERVAEIATAINEAGEALILYAAHFGFQDAGDLEALVEEFADAHIGEFDSLADYAEERLHELFRVPDHLAPYIDYRAFEIALEHDGFWFSGGHVFGPA